MDTILPISGKAVLTLWLGLLSVACGLLALTSGPDLLFLGVIVFWALAFVLGVYSWIEITRAPDKVRGKALAGWGMALPTAGLVLGFLLLPPIWMVREASFKVAGANNLYQIVLAMAHYADDHGSRLPPAVLRDRDGRPLHSWRVLLLPYLEEERLYREFRLDEPWDSPHNLALLPRMPKVYAPPRGLPAEVRAGPSRTFYQVFTGPGTAFDGAEGQRLPQDFPDGTADTILVIEAGEAVPWTRPEDLVYDPQGPLPPLGGVFTGEGGHSLTRGNLVKGFQVGLGDGSVRLLVGLSEATLRNAITRNDGGRLGPDW